MPQHIAIQWSFMTLIQDRKRLRIAVAIAKHQGFIRDLMTHLGRYCSRLKLRRHGHELHFLRLGPTAGRPPGGIPDIAINAAG